MSTGLMKNCQVFALALTFGMPVSVSWAQPVPNGPAPAEQKREPGSKFPDGLPTKDVIFYLYKEFFNLDSKPDYVVIPLDFWQQTLSQLRSREQTKQPWTITELAITGTLDQQNETRLKMELGVGGVTGEDGAVVDLKMPQASFIDARSSDGKAAALYRTADGNYQLAIDQPGDFRYTFELFVDTERTPSENRLQLSLPDASVKRVELRSSEDLLFARDPVTHEQLEIGEDKRTLRPPLRAGDSLSLAWRAGKPSESPTASGQRVHSILEYRLGGSTIVTEANLSVDLGVQSPKCQFSLPVGEVIRSVTGTRVGPNQEDQPLLVTFESKELQDRVELQVTFAEPVSGQVKLKVVSERDRPPGDQPCRLGHFELQGAESQTGYVLLFTKDDLWIRSDPKQGMRWIELLQLDPELQRKQPVRAFQFSSQPATLELQLQTEPFITASSETKITVGPSAAKITTNFRFLIRQAETSVLRLRVPTEMQVDEIGPLKLIKQEASRPVEGSPGLREIPLVFSEPKIGTVDVELRGTMPINKEQTNGLRIPCPSPEVRWTGGVTVDTESGWTLEVDDQKLHHLRREPLPSERTPERLVWYFRHDRPDPVLAFRCLQLPRKVDVAVDSKFHWSDERMVVDSILRFRTNFTRLEDVVLKVPAELANVTIVGGTATVGTQLTPGKHVLQLLTPSHECDIQLRYDFPASSEGPVSIEVPLVLPENASVISYKGTIWCDPGMRVGAEPPWESGTASPSDPSTLEDQASLVVTSDNPPDRLKLQLDPSVALAPLVVPRILIEEILGTNGVRWGVKRLLVATHRIRDLRIVVPDGCQIDRIAVDGMLVRATADSVRIWRIGLPATNRPCSVEISYLSAVQPRRWAAIQSLRLDTPYIVDDVAIQEVRWLVKAPSEVLLLNNEGANTGDLRWKWTGFLHRPVPAIDEKEMSHWLKVADPSIEWSDSLKLPDGESTKVWSLESWGHAQGVTVWIVPHSFWILLCSGLLLVIGLSVSRSSVAIQLRTAAVLITVAALGLLLAPEWMAWIWLGGQWGVYLAVAAIAFRALALRRRRLRYMIGRPIRRQERLGSSLSSLVRRLQPEDRTGAAKMGTTIDA